MTGLTRPAAAGHVEAYCSTGTSPGSASVAARLELELGGTLDTRISYAAYGPPTAPPVVVLGGISADRHLAPTPDDPTPGWWPGVIGAGLGLDPTRRRLIGMDWVAGGATADAERRRVRVTTRDQARAVAAVLDTLDVDRVDLVGASYGGMVGLRFAELFPTRLNRLVVLCAAHRTHPMATALRVLQRRLAASPLEGALALARALAMTTYRSAVEFDRRFDWRPVPGEGGFPVEEYLDARGGDFARRFDAGVFAALSESIDLHAVDPAAITTPTTVVSADTDALVPPWLVDELARCAPGVVGHLTLDTPFGHDAFLKEAEPVSAILRAALGGGGAS